MSDMKTVRLTRVHTHEGKKYAPGTDLPLPTRIADWLIGQNVADELTPGTATRPAVAIRRTRCCGR